MDIKHFLVQKLFPDDEPEQDNNQSEEIREEAHRPYENENSEEEELKVNNELVEAVIKNLKSNKAPGPDNMKNKIYKINKELCVGAIPGATLREMPDTGSLPASMEAGKVCYTIKMTRQGQNGPRIVPTHLLVKRNRKIFEKIIVNKINKNET